MAGARHAGLFVTCVALAVTDSRVQHSWRYGIVLGHHAQATLTGTTYLDNPGDIDQAP